MGKNKKFKRRLTANFIKFIKKYEPPKLKIFKTNPAEIYLSNLDRIFHAGIINENGDLVEVTNVSYDIKLNEGWVTIVRYDSVHGYLHRHKRISLGDSVETVDRIGVKQKGNPKVWYTWAIKDIQKRFLQYRQEFTKRSGIPDVGY